MGFFSGYSLKHISNQIELNCSSEVVWREITDVMLYNSSFPIVLSLLGIPKPVSATVVKPEVGGCRIANFSNNSQFHQDLLEWDFQKMYRFSFNATRNFKVGYFLNLSKGPFEIITGGYKLDEKSNVTILELSSSYKLKGFAGCLLHIPFRMVVFKFQKHLLSEIRKNCSLNLRENSIYYI